ncbi:MAG: hypothetical protein V1244_01255 [Nitrospinaceae bacterium]|nr:hypothetical protein [Nitrospinaceae bacterium]
MMILYGIIGVILGLALMIILTMRYMDRRAWKRLNLKDEED